VYYVVADERDLIRLCTHYRGERVFLYRTTMPVAQARALPLDYLADANRLAEHLRWYNALTHNCTTTLPPSATTCSKSHRAARGTGAYSRTPMYELTYEHGAIETTLPFAELRARSDITERAKAADQDPDFSQRIREGLPCPRVAGC
jgi:hypothetical protein